MNRLKEEWSVGQPVWAQFRSVGWRPAVITHIGHKWITLIFYSAPGGPGKRESKDLRPRDPALKGADKPSDNLERPLRGKMGEEATEASGGAVAARSGGMGREGRVMRNVQLGRDEY